MMTPYLTSNFLIYHLSIISTYLLDNLSFPSLSLIYQMTPLYSTNPLVFLTFPSLSLK